MLLEIPRPKRPNWRRAAYAFSTRCQPQTTYAYLAREGRTYCVCFKPHCPVRACAAFLRAFFAPSKPIHCVLDPSPYPPSHPQYRSYWIEWVVGRTRYSMPLRFSGGVIERIPYLPSGVLHGLAEALDPHADDDLSSVAEVQHDC